MPLLSSAKISPEEIKLGSENPEGVVSYVGALTNKQSLAFTYAKQWVSKTFNNYKAVVQLEDNDNYKIVRYTYVPTSGSDSIFTDPPSFFIMESTRNSPMPVAFLSILPL